MLHPSVPRIRTPARVSKSDFSFVGRKSEAAAFYAKGDDGRRTDTRERLRIVA